jgi:hypothetical protein
MVQMTTNSDTLFAQLNIPPPFDTVDPESRDRELEALSRDLIQKSRLDYFNTMCPREFCSPIDRTLLRNLNAWDEANKWTPGEYPGIWLWSPETGLGKTRMLWKKVGQAVVSGKRYIFITGIHLGEWYYECFRDGEPLKFYGRFRNHDVVMLDDLDKYPVDDERAARALRELWDNFYRNHVSVIVSANEPPEFMQERIGHSAYRRITEVCQPIQF